MNIEFRSPTTKDEWGQYYELRYEVMSKPSGYDRSSVHEEKDSVSYHVAAFDGYEIVGVGRLHYDDEDFSKGYIRFMAVDTKKQSKGIGSQILNELEEIAKKNGTNIMKLKARENAVHFYEKNGYTLGDKCTENFFKTPHWNMSKKLD